MYSLQFSKNFQLPENGGHFEFSNFFYCIPGAKWGYYGFIIVRVRRDFLLATYSPHFFPDFFHIWQVA